MLNLVMQARCGVAVLIPDPKFSLYARPALASDTGTQPEPLGMIIDDLKYVYAYSMPLW